MLPVERSMSWCLLLSLLAATPVANARVATGHRYFQAGQFEAALAEYQGAARAGARGEATWQIAVTLVQLGRIDDALEAFALAQRQAPDTEQPLQRFYRAVACMKARLWQCAEETLAPLPSKLPGPLAAHALELGKVAGVQKKLAAAGGLSAWYEARAQAALTEGKPALAEAYRAEAERVRARTQLLRRDGMMDPLMLSGLAGAAEGKLLVMALMELGYDSNPRLLTASDPQKKNAGFPQSGGIGANLLAFGELRPLGVSGPFAQAAVSHRAESRTWFDELSLLSVLGTAGWRAVGARSDLSVAYSFQHAVLNGNGFVSTHRVSLRAGVSAGPLWLDGSLTSQYDRLLPAAVATLSGARHGTQTRVTWNPSDRLRLSGGYRVDLVFQDNAGVLFTEHGPTLEAEGALTSQLSLGLSANAWFRAVPADSPFGAHLQDRNLEAILAATFRPIPSWSVRLALTAGSGLYSARQESALRATCVLGLAYATALL